MRRTRNFFYFSLLLIILFSNPVSLEGRNLASLPDFTRHVYARPLVEETSKLIYVKKDATGEYSGESWEDAFVSLQDGLDAASDGDEIWVAQGVYTPTLRTVITDTCSVTFSLIQGVAIYGGFVGNEPAVHQRDWRNHPTILSGDLLSNDAGMTENKEDNAYHVVTAWNLDRSARLDGFIISGGYADSSCPSTSSPESDERSTLDLNVQHDHVEKGNQVDACNPSTSFESGGGLYACSANPVLANLVFTGNYANQGGGQYAKESSILMVNCAWIGNRAEFGGGVMNSGSSPTIVNALLNGNVAGSVAGGFYNLFGSSPIIINATFTNNDAIRPDGVDTIHNTYASHIELWNSIIWSDSENHFKNEESSTIDLSYSVIRGGCAGVEGLTCNVVLEDDPLFRDEDGEDNIVGNLDDDLRLESVSPAIDHGDNSAVPLDTIDLDADGDYSEQLPQDFDGGFRFSDTPMEDLGSGIPPIVDMGAFETQNFIFLPIIRKSGS